MSRIIRCDDDIDYTTFDIKVGDYLRCEGSPVYIQTPFHHMSKYGIPKESEFFPNITRRSQIKLEIKQEMKLYKFYKRLDTFFLGQLIKMKTKNIIHDMHINYEGIINNDRDFIKYSLGYNRIENESLIWEQHRVRAEITESYLPRIQSGYHNTSIMACLELENKLDDEFNKDKYFNFEYKYKLYESTDEEKFSREIKFHTLGKFASYIKFKTNLRFLIKPRLKVYQHNGENIYFVQLYVYSVEITKKQSVNFGFDYEYMTHRFSTLKPDIVSIRYKPLLIRS